MLPLGPHGHVMAVMQNDAEVPRQWMLRLASLELRIALKRKSLYYSFLIFHNHLAPTKFRRFLTDINHQINDKKIIA